MSQRDSIESYVRENSKDALLTHDFSHFRRVAAGAEWFVRLLGGDKEEKELAYIAGLLHDIVRPGTEKVDHAVASAEKSRDILKGFALEEEAIRMICQAIRDHRKPAIWESPLHQSVFLADKILEQMGHYVAFRRCMYVGECRDYKGKPFEESIIKHFAYRIGKFDYKKDFPEMFHGLVNHMFIPLKDFDRHFRDGHSWALSLARHCYDAARSSNVSMDEVIGSFQPEGGEANKWKIETLDYMNGKKFKEWERLV